MYHEARRAGAESALCFIFFDKGTLLHLPLASRETHPARTQRSEPKTPQRPGLQANVRKPEPLSGAFAPEHRSLLHQYTRSPHLHQRKRHACITPPPNPLTQSLAADAACDRRGVGGQPHRGNAPQLLRHLIAKYSVRVVTSRPRQLSVSSCGEPRFIRPGGSLFTIWCALGPVGAERGRGRAIHRDRASKLEAQTLSTRRARSECHRLS